MSRSRWLLLIALFVASAVLSACGNKSTYESSAVDPIQQAAKNASSPKGYTSFTFDDMYVNPSSTDLSPKIQELSGQQVQMNGFMAPPLTPELEFFVLTRYMMEQCPFCNAVMNWPRDIVVIYLPEGQPMEATDHPLFVKGRLDVGPYKDELTGFVSLVRIYADKVEELE
ncbi:hypothetical protein ACFPYJ_26715 [Paenibacillus solisilvae]|uniref:Uncharacterized protein n=1 Tax=Paenibacillus solisilvae TaxID=2486751 RepID=A0ABW0W397_9BACL